MILRYLTSILFILFLSTSLHSQEKSTSVWDATTFEGLKMRNIGPALMAGRIADIAIHPTNDNVWYVAVGSGGVWKTENSGITWKTIFDDQSCYSTGCITIDPSNSNVIWLGTGENVGGRHVGFGDGVYRSDDGGSTWKNMGLIQSEHISRIIVHPDNSDVIWVAAQGPLWSKGGERGLYKSIDGGKSWKQVLGNNEWTGVTEVVIDPTDPQVLYAATWDRHRTIAAYMGGGPGSGLHKSEDGGESWKKLTSGLPKSNLGKTGLAISPHKPNVLYAAIEQDLRKGGVYKSTDYGATWTKQSDAISGGTGPHYYQELYACPHNFDRIYLMDVRIQVSDNGGKNFRKLTEKHKHSDNHSITFRKDGPNYLLVGTDGGIYESYDLGANWRFIENMPITQFYKLAVDDTEPFYNVYGGTQDNSTEGGPVRTDNVQGIQNADWKVVLDWDGHQPATEPGNPNIVYGQRQEGTLARIDMATGEVVDIQPQPGEDEDYERYNWDAPILVSPHSPTRIYFASQRLWKSDNRGDDWTAISGDLTKNQNRFNLPIMGKQQSIDNAWDVLAMSNYNTITSIAESPLQQDLLYIGTDDGHVQISSNGGESWRKLSVGSLSGVPETAYVNNIMADMHDANTAYIALDNHKYGDYKPYLFKTTDKGATWKSIVSNLPSRNLVWRLVQDHVDPNLLFIGTEYGVYFSVNGGGRWTELSGGMPTIPTRDLTIQRRENDLVCATFGRSFYVLDDISPLRNLNDSVLSAEATLFPLRDTWWYVPRSDLGFYGSRGDQGAGHFVADNPPFGAVFTYYVKEGMESSKDIRKKEEKKQAKQNQSVEFPGWETLLDEKNESKNGMVLTIHNDQGEVVRRIDAPGKKGFHRVSWDLRYPVPNAVKMKADPPPQWGGPPTGLMAAPGTYTVTLSKRIMGEMTDIGESQTFEVKQLHKGSLPGASMKEVSAFWRGYEDAVRSSSALNIAMANTLKKVSRMNHALSNSKATSALDQRLHKVKLQVTNLSNQLSGNAVKLQVGEKTKPTIGDRLFAISRVVGGSSYGPTTSATTNLDICHRQIKAIGKALQDARTEISAIAQEIRKQGGPWIEGEDLGF